MRSWHANHSQATKQLRTKKLEHKHFIMYSVHFGFHSPKCLFFLSKYFRVNFVRLPNYHLNILFFNLFLVVIFFLFCLFFFSAGIWLGIFASIPWTSHWSNVDNAPRFYRNQRRQFYGCAANSSQRCIQFPNEKPNRDTRSLSN